VIIVRPFDRGGPLTSLAVQMEAQFPMAVTAAVAPAEGGDTLVATAPPRSWAELIVSSPKLAEEISAAVDATNANLCIVIDQFEEVFHLVRGGRESEVARLIGFVVGLDAATKPGEALGGRPLSVVLTMRSDYLGQCARWDAFAETVNRAQYLLPRLSNLGLLRAIHKLAQRMGGTVDDGVADRLRPIMTGQIDGLPIVQHALMRAWAHARDRDKGDPPSGKTAVTTDDLDKVGGAEEALSRHAEEALKSATRGEAQARETAEWIFRSLSDVDSDGKIVRRSSTLGDLVKVAAASETVVRRIVDVFRSGENSLLSPYAPKAVESDTLIDVSHEALLRNWTWISSDAYGDRGVPRGLAFREVQDGMIWRSLVVQAGEYAENPGRVLSPAATEQRLPWYEIIRRRPAWANRHRTRATAGTPLERQKEWDSVAKFIDASRENLAIEQGKLERERGLVVMLRRSRLNQFLSLSALILVILASAATFGWYLYSQQAAQTNLINEQLNLKQQALQIEANKFQQVNELARRICIGESPGGKPTDDCLARESITQYKLTLKQQAPTTTLPISPFGGGLVAAPKKP
jgi:hypothetical protein